MRVAYKPTTKEEGRQPLGLVRRIAGLYYGSLHISRDLPIVVGNIYREIANGYG